MIWGILAAVAVGLGAARTSQGDTASLWVCALIALFCAYQWGKRR